MILREKKPQLSIRLWIAGVMSVSTLGLTACGEDQKDQVGEPQFHEEVVTKLSPPTGLKLTKGELKPKFQGRIGEFVPVTDLKSQEIPEKYWETIHKKVEKYKTVLVVSKSYNLHILFKDGKAINWGPAGIGNEKKSEKGNLRITPVGDFKIHRKEGKSHTSGEFEGADMGYAIYFSDHSTGTGNNKTLFQIGNKLDAMRGVAFHSSKPRYKIINGKMYFKVNDSNGCVNAFHEDAQLASKTLQAGDMVVVLQ